MIDKVTAYVKKYAMIKDKDTVIAGVSGGADSVCLLLVLLELQRQWNYKLWVVHIEHGIRGEASLHDAEFVQKLCAHHGVECTTYSYDVPSIARERGQSEEEAGRQLRYEAFDKVAKLAGADAAVRIAVAHNQNDNAETMLHNLVRGSAIAGAAGIAPVRGRIIRPLLCVERSEIEAYLTKKQQAYCTDETNFELDYTRNRIRHEVLPELVRLNGQAISHMAQSAEVLRQTQEYMEQQAEMLAEQAVEWQKESALIRSDKLRSQPAVLQRQLIYQVIGTLAGSRKDVSAVHIAAVLELFEHQVGHQSSLPYQLCAQRVYEGVRLTVISEELKKRETKSGKNRCGMGANVLAEDERFRIQLLEKSNNIADFPKKKYTKWLDYDKIKDSLCVRTRQSGDYLIIDEAGHKKKLKQYFVDEKIPQEIRDEIILVADGSHIVWIVGYRISAQYKMTENTTRIIEIQYDGGIEENE